LLLCIIILIPQITPSLHLVEVGKGDTLEFHEFYKNLSNTLNNVVWKSDDLQSQHS
ncbi:Os08g0496750, partial [Oryza sativa Japonica Group]